MKVRADMGSTERDGFMATLEFEPGGSYSSIVDLYYSTMDQTDNARSLEINLGGYPSICCGSPFPDGTVLGYSDTTIENDTAVAGTLNNITPLARNFLFTTEDEILAGGWRNSFQLSDTWSLVADVSYSKATRDQLQSEIDAQRGPALDFDTGTFELRGNDDMPSLSFPLDYTDPTQVFIGPTIYGGGYTKKPSVEDELTSFRVDTIREAEAWWFAGMAFGVNYSERTKEKVSPETVLTTTGGLVYQVADEFLLRPTDLGYADAPNTLAVNVNGVLGEYFNPVVHETPETRPSIAGKFWDVEEDVCTGYVRGDLNHVISDTVTLAGNVGIQLISTDQASTGLLVANAGTADQAIVTTGDGKSYTDWLPQVNIAFLLPNDQAIRFGLAKELARARMDQLKATEESGYNSGTGEPSGSGGNPMLDPWRAYAFDVSYEKYFADRGGYVSVAGFYKDLRSYIFNQTDPNHDYSELLAVTPASHFGQGVVPQTTGDFILPVNGEGGYLWGLELATCPAFRAVFGGARWFRRDPELLVHRERHRRSWARSARWQMTTFRCRVCRRTSGTRRCTTRSMASAPASPRAIAPSTSAR